MKTIQHLTSREQMGKEILKDVFEGIENPKATFFAMTEKEEGRPRR